MPDPRLAAPQFTEYDAVVHDPQVQVAPSKPLPGWRLRRPLGFSGPALTGAALGLNGLGLGGLLAAVCIGVAAMGAVAAGIPPEFYRDRLAALPTVSLTVAPAVAAEQAGRRLVTKVAALQAALDRDGAWEAALAEEEINGWLAVDLPRNHPQILPPGWSDPRLVLEPGRIRAAAHRAVRGPLGGIVSLAIDVRLRQRNVVECTVADARLGVIPLPRAAWLHWIATQLGPLGLPTEIRRRDGQSILAITLVATDRNQVSLEALAVDAGELLMAGTVTHTAGGRDSRGSEADKR